MDLELASGTIVQDVTATDLASLIGGEDFAILSTAPQRYMQCARSGDSEDEYILEYREGSATKHFRAADTGIKLHDVIFAFTSYLAGDEAWKTAFHWEKVIF